MKREIKQRYIILDCETGGLNCLENPITEIAMIAVDRVKFEEVNRWETFVKPYADLVISPKALQMTGISMDQINSGKSVDKMVDVMIKFFESVTPPHDRGRNKPLIVGHNVGFDIRFISKAFELVDKQLYNYVSSSAEDKYNPREGDIGRLDTMYLSREHWKDDGKFSLFACCKRIGIDIIDSHRAMNDVLATWKLLEFLMTRFSVDKKKSGIKVSEEEKELDLVMMDRDAFEI